MSMPRRLHLRLPVFALVLAFTAVPVEFRMFSGSVPDLFRPGLQDIVLNIAGFIPIGFVLASCRARSMLLAAAATSSVAEVSQVFAIGRSPSVVDLVMNIIGAAIGWYLAHRLNVSPRSIAIGRRAATVAAVLAVAYVVVGARFVPRDLEDGVAAAISSADALSATVNPRGDTDPGALEAAWRFDNQQRAVVDASGNALGGSFMNGARVTTDETGDVLTLDGADQFVDMGDPVALRLVGSMTLSAWMKASSFAGQDGAIVSRRARFGFQLDTTIYRGPSLGPHTIGFRLANASGRFMARFGRTPLDQNRWYHVAGVYDAHARTLNVYLDGALDNGCLIGDVTSRQLLSDTRVLVGRSGRRDGYWFKGRLDDVRIYSRALAQSEIETMVRETARGRSLSPPTQSVARYPGWDEPACVPRPTDARAAGLFIAFGLVTAVACAGLWPTPAFRAPAIVCALAAGLLVLPSIPETIPAYYRLVIPMLFLAGGIVAVISMRPAVDTASD
jgi:concanavalin A-like lectin/glucanase superfamily protein/VanZ like protein